MKRIYVDVPDSLYEFLEKLANFADVDIEEYVAHTLIDGIQGDVERSHLETCIDFDALIENYHVKDWFKEWEKERSETSHQKHEVQIGFSDKAIRLLEIAAKVDNKSVEEYCREAVLSAIEGDLESGVLKAIVEEEAEKPETQKREG